MTPHILRNAVFLIFRTPPFIVTQNHTNSYIFNTHEFWPPPMLRNLWTIPNHHKQSKIINCNVIQLYLVSFAVILQLKLCLKYLSPWHSKWHILHLSIRVKINMITYGIWPLLTNAKCVILNVTDLYFIRNIHGYFWISMDIRVFG
jgi:hypothetical protein